MLIRPYGDRLNDGAVQLSFTLPLDASGKAVEVAREYVLRLGFESCEVAHASPLMEGFTMFVAYGWTNVSIDPDEVEMDPGLYERSMDFHEVNAFIKEKIERKLVVVGACTGFDAHTVGIDAIMNMKGYDRHYGLERYPMIEAHNLGAQVPNRELLNKAVELGADAVLVSQTVTQKDAHLVNLRDFQEEIEKMGLKGRFILLLGGPRITHKIALEMGFDAGFGKGCLPETAASFIAQRLYERKE